MLTPELARQILHTVNLQINSNTFAIKPKAGYNIFKHFSLFSDTRKALKELDKSYPTQKLNKRDNLYSEFAHLYTNLRSAYEQQDEPMLHRYLTNELYQAWKDKRKNALNIYKTVYDIKLKQAQLYENQYGKWVQCLVRFKFAGGKNDKAKEIYKQHVIERKLKMMPNQPRTWYFAAFQN